MLSETAFLRASLSIAPAAVLFVTAGTLDFETSSPGFVHAAMAQAVRSGKRSRVKRSPCVVLMSMEGVFAQCRYELLTSLASAWQATVAEPA